MQEWETKYNDLVEQNAKEASERAFNTLLDASLKKFNVRDDAAVKVHLNLDKVKEGADDESKTKELEEQLTNMQKEKDYLFNVETAEDTSSSIYNYVPSGGNDSTDSSYSDVINAIKGIF